MKASIGARSIRSLVALFLAAVGLTIMAPPASAAGLTTQALGTGSPALSATDLVTNLLGSGVTASNITYTGASGASGTFAGGTGIVGFESGVLLTSGHVNNVIGPNASDSKTTANGVSGDSDLNAVSGKTTLDASVLQFDFVPTKSPVFFNYVFGSDEYNEYVNTSFNDAFAFLVNGANCAKIPGTSDAVTIDNVNKVTNSTYYRNNDLSDGAATINTEMDGLTTVFSCEAVVTPNATNHVKLVVADSSDHAYDSAVFLEAGSFTPDPPSNNPPTADAGGPYTVNEGSTVQLNGTGTDPDAGDTLTYSWSPATSLDDATLEDPLYTGVDDVVDTLTLTVTDGSGATAADTTTVTVANVAPEITSLTAPTAPVPVGTTITSAVSYTDPGAADTHDATFTWGDATADTTVPGSAGSASAGHTYTAAGVYTVGVTVDDDDGGSDTAQLQYVVVYDPNGGFVTGGGWIDSAAGSYPADPSLTGKANFGFVSKYQKGTAVPAGSTQFQFHAGDLNFHSTSYEWLVIGGSRAQYKGAGTINGAGSYSFLLTATDGQVTGGGGVDRFRIKIWDTVTGAVVYDNQIGAADDASPSTALGGGSIVIHTKK